MRSLIVLGAFFIFLILMFTSQINAQDIQADIYVEASIDNPNPYVGQQVIYSFKLYDAVGLTNPLYQPSNFEGFWRIDIGVVSQTSEQINGRRYTVTTISTALYPTHSGSITIQPSSVVLPETVFRAKQTLTANAISLDVKRLPNRMSANFNGAVGQFTMSATLDRQAVKVGEPIVMTLVVSGTGNVEQLPPPTVPDHWRTTINTGIYKSEIQNGLIIGSRNYQIVFMPSTATTQVLPPVTLDYFDPVSSTYKSIGTSSIPIQVNGGSVAVPNVAPDISISEPSLNLKPIDNLSPNAPSTVIVLLSALLPLILVIMIWYQQRLKLQRGLMRAQLRRQKALFIAIQDLKAISLTDSKLSYKQIDIVFKRYVADMLDMDVALVKQSDLLQLLSTKTVSANTSAKIELFMSQIDAFLFSPASDIMSAQKRDNVIEVLRDIDKEWAVR